jgi:hypothetical protein
LICIPVQLLATSSTSWRVDRLTAGNVVIRLQGICALLEAATRKHDHAIILFMPILAVIITD